MQKNVSTELVERCFDRLHRAAVAPAEMARLNFAAICPRVPASGGLVSLPVAIYRPNGTSHAIVYATDPAKVFPPGATEVDWSGGGVSGRIVVVVEDGAPYDAALQVDTARVQEVHTGLMPPSSLRRALEKRKLDAAAAHAEIHRLSAKVVQGAIRRTASRWSVLAPWRDDAEQDAYVAIYQMAERFASLDRPRAAWWHAARVAAEKAVSRSANRAGGHSADVGKVAAEVERISEYLGRTPTKSELEVAIPASSVTIDLATTRPWVTVSLDGISESCATYDSVPDDAHHASSPSNVHVAWSVVLAAAERRGWLGDAPTDDQAVATIASLRHGHVAVARMLGRLLDSDRRLVSRPPASRQSALAAWLATDLSWGALAAFLEDSDLRISRSVAMAMVSSSRTHCLAALDDLAGIKPRRRERATGLR